MSRFVPSWEKKISDLSIPLPLLRGPCQRKKTINALAPSPFTIEPIVDCPKVAFDVFEYMVEICSEELVHKSRRYAVPRTVFKEKPSNRREIFIIIMYTGVRRRGWTICRGIIKSGSQFPIRLYVVRYLTYPFPKHILPGYLQKNVKLSQARLLHYFQ